MDISLIKKEMKLRVKFNLTSTKINWSLDDEGVMKSMRGKTYKVTKVEHSKNGVILYDPDGEEEWMFCSEDLADIIETTPIPPVIFDPENICE